MPKIKSVKKKREFDDINIEASLIGYTVHIGDSSVSGHYQSETRVWNEITNGYHYVLSDD